MAAGAGAAASATTAEHVVAVQDVPPIEPPANAVPYLASVPSGLAPTGLALRRVLRNLLLGTRNRSKIHPKSIGLLIVFVSLILDSIHSET